MSDSAARLLPRLMEDGWHGDIHSAFDVEQQHHHRRRSVQYLSRRTNPCSCWPLLLKGDARDESEISSQTLILSSAGGAPHIYLRPNLGRQILICAPGICFWDRLPPTDYHRDAPKIYLEAAAFLSGRAEGSREARGAVEQGQGGGHGYSPE